DLDRVLVAEVVGALDRVIGVLFGAVLGGVAESRVDPALGRAGVAPDRVDLREESDVGARVVRLDGCAHAGAAGADDEDVVLRFHHLGRYTNRTPCGRASAAKAWVRSSSPGRREEMRARGEDAVPPSRGEA